MNQIIATVITGIFTIAGIIVTAVLNARNTTAKLEKSQAITDTKLDELTREVREHNNFARRMPVVEEKLKGIDHRLDNLEGFHKVDGGWQK